MRLLVTGGAGFIGSHYVRSLLAGAYPSLGDATVTVLDSLTYAGNTANLPLGDHRLTFVKADVCDSELLADLVPGHDAVVHFAAESHVDRSILGGRRFVVTNVLGTQSLLDACVDARVSRVVHVSSDEVYGPIEQGSWTEECRLAPSSPYSASKAAGDLLALAYHRTRGLDVRITRGCNTYGPYQFPEKIIPLFVTNILRGQSVPVYGDGSNIREWLHIDDHCRGIQLALENGSPGEVYNIGGGTPLSNNELTERLLRICEASDRLVRHVADRKGHDRRYSIDWTRARERLGYRPSVPFDRGLPETVQWYRENRWWWAAPRH